MWKFSKWYFSSTYDSHKSQWFKIKLGDAIFFFSGIKPVDWENYNITGSS